MTRDFPIEDWSSHGRPFKPRAPASSLRAIQSSHDYSLEIATLPRKRMQSLLLTRLDLNMANNNIHSSSLSDDGTDTKRAGGIRSLFRKASTSIGHRRRHVHVQEERPRTAWGKLRTATGFQWQSKFLTSASESRIDSEDDQPKAPVLGNISQPPLIPRGLSGSAARAAAAAENRIAPLSTVQSDDFVESRQTLSTREQQEDRESGIGIAITTASSIYLDHSDSHTTCSDISRVDFISCLPPELAIQILSHLDQKTLRSIARVSREWNKISQTQCIWREVFMREQTKTYAASKPIALGAGLGLPAPSADNDWKDLYRVREQLKQNWIRGSAEAIYLNGHLDSIYCVQFDEKKIITGSRDKTIRVWDLKKYVCTLIIGPPGVINNPSTMIGSDGRPQHYTTMPDLTRKPAEKHPTAVSFPVHHNQSILCLQYDKKILVTGSSDSTCIIHDIENGYQPIRQLRHHTESVLDLVFDDRHIVTCSKDVTICVWDREAGTLIKQLRGHGGPVNAVQLRGNTIVSCSGDLRVKLWCIDTGKNIKELAGHTKGLACSQFSDDSRFIASAGNDKVIRIWDANTGETLKSIVAHDNLVRSLYIDSLSGRLVSGSYDQDIKVFDMATGALLLAFPKWHSSWVLGAKSDYRRMISTGQDPKILIMDFGAGIKGIEALES